jgi:hypothetical protein
MSAVDITLRLTVSQFPISLSKQQALEFWRNYPHLHGRYMIMGASWRSDEFPGEEGWFEELGADELESDHFQDDFAEAKLQLWPRAQ